MNFRSNGETVWRAIEEFQHDPYHSSLNYLSKFAEKLLFRQLLINCFMANLYFNTLVAQFSNTQTFKTSRTNDLFEYNIRQKQIQKRAAKQLPRYLKQNKAYHFTFCLSLTYSCYQKKCSLLIFDEFIEINNCLCLIPFISSPTEKEYRPHEEMAELLQVKRRLLG